MMLNMLLSSIVFLELLVGVLFIILLLYEDKKELATKLYKYVMWLLVVITILFSLLMLSLLVNYFVNDSDVTVSILLTLYIILSFVYKHLNKPMADVVLNTVLVLTIINNVYNII